MEGIAIVLLLIAIKCSAQHARNWQPIKYVTDTLVPSKVNSFKLTESMALKNAMHIRVDKSKRMFFNQAIDCYAFAVMLHDTIFISGYMKGMLGWGFQLTLFNDSCIIGSFARSDGRIYTSRVTDKTPVSYIAMSSSTQICRLSQKPRLRWVKPSVVM